MSDVTDNISADAVDNTPFIIVFDDADKAPEFVFGRKVAEKRFEDVSLNWNAHLFAKVSSNCRDDPFYGANVHVLGECGHYDPEVIGNNVIQVRKAKKISQQGLAQKAGIDRSYMGRIERGQVNVTAKILFQLAEALKCPVTVLLP